MLLLPDRRSERLDSGRLRRVRRARRRRRLRRTCRCAPNRSRVGARTSLPPAERPGDLAACGATPSRGSVPRGRQRCRADRLRPVRNGERGRARTGRPAGASARPGFRDQRGTVERDVREPRDRARVDAHRALASRAPVPVHAVDRGVRGPSVPLPRAPLVGRRPAGGHRRRLLVVRRARQPVGHAARGRGGSSPSRSCSSSAFRSRSPSSKAIAIGVIALLAIAALIFLFTERPK